MIGEGASEGGVLLAAIGREVGCLAAEAHRLQDVLAGIGGTCALSPEALVGVQALDALAQHATELGAVLASLSALAPANWEIAPGQVLNRVPLAGLVRRLTSEAHDPAHEHPAGEFEMF